MPLPGNRTLNTADLTAYTPSCGASPVASYVRVPFRCRLLKIAGILGGAITTADGTITAHVERRDDCGVHRDPIGLRCRTIVLRDAAIANLPQRGRRHRFDAIRRIGLVGADAFLDLREGRLM